MPLQATSGAASYDAFGGGVPVLPNYIEEVFSTFLYAGTGGADLTVTNGIDLATKGGIVWKKRRNGVSDNLVFQAPGVGDSWLITNSTAAQTTGADVIDFSTTGFVDRSGDSASNTYASWTFRKQNKFFDVVTYTGNGTQGRQIAHSLGAPPGCIFVKRTSTTSNWAVYHDGIGPSQYLNLNTTAAAASSSAYWDDASPTATVFTVGNNAEVNATGSTYVAYIFSGANGGFGLTGTDNVISCGSFTTSGGGNATVSLGYEPQWILVKRTDTGGPNWLIFDNMRGLTVSGNCVSLAPNTNAADTVQSAVPRPNATGFTAESFSSIATYIYIAIRRGPMKVPTTGTTVYSPQTATGVQTTNFVVDAFIGVNNRASPGSFDPFEKSRLQGGVPYLTTSSTAAEASGSDVGFDSNTGVKLSWGAGGVNWYFQRAPGFFDVVCFTGNNTYGYKNHNLTVVPELIISKRRDASQDWLVWQPSNTYAGYLNLTDAFYNNGPSPATATQFTPILDQSSATYVVYLFASAPGVSKVGSYTGNGTTQAIACGFTGGARFVLIKRTDASGAWYVYDTARGMTVLTDPYLLLNSTAAEVATLGSVTTTAGGFTVDATILTAINASGGTYIFLAIA
jgi:hypothetical protein